MVNSRGLCSCHSRFVRILPVSGHHLTAAVASHICSIQPSYQMGHEQLFWARRPSGVNYVARGARQSPPEGKSPWSGFAWDPSGNFPDGRENTFQFRIFEGTEIQPCSRWIKNTPRSLASISSSFAFLCQGNGGTRTPGSTSTATTRISSLCTSLSHCS
jgi:hypothetical protein